jgi:hypothetical protein
VDVLKEIRVQDAEGKAVYAQYWIVDDFVYLSAPDGEVTMLRETIMGSEATARVMLRQWVSDREK